MRKLMAVALVLVVATAAGCTPGRKKRGSRSSDSDAAAAGNNRRSSPSPSASAQDLKKRIRAAVIPVGGPVTVGGPAETDEPDEEDLFRLGRVCDAELPTDQVGENHGLQRTWKDEKLWVSHLVTGNRDVTAAQAVAAVKTAYGTCRTYTVEGTQYTIVAPLQLGPLAGVEMSYAWTERSAKGGTKGAVCEAYLGRGPLVSWVTVVGSTMDGATTGCRQIVKLAAEQLAKA